jgi:hypothetical protein
VYLAGGVDPGSAAVCIYDACDPLAAGRDEKYPEIRQAVATSVRRDDGNAEGTG